MTDDCIPWEGALNEQGYGRKGSKLAHRWVWEQVKGPIPPDTTIDHTCHNPATCRLARQCPHRRCINTDHMELVSGSENARRGGRRKAWLTECPLGHPYSGDNLMICRGARYCLTCRRTQQAARRVRLAEAECRSRGHLREERVDSSGRNYCVVCRIAHGKKTTAARVRSATGQYAAPS